VKIAILRALTVTVVLAASMRARALPDPVPMPVKVARGVFLIPEVPIPDREPDGNSVVIEAPEGLIVFDTGRHPWHQQALLALAAREGKPIAAVINSHWHLDHVSGNPVLRARYPRLKVYASSAIDGALTGFLADSASSSSQYLDDPQIPEPTKADIRADIGATRNGAALRPDVVVERSGVMRIAGRSLRVNLATHAATAGDVWLHDEQTHLVVLGDLVTLPAPYLDTACPDGWSIALSRIDSIPFTMAIPGHGALMSHAGFARYRLAFEAFIACTKTDQPSSACASAWTEAVAPLLSPGVNKLERAKATADYYVQMLRTNGARNKFCAVGAA
jgi:glyoxylase-like metal-dependent hydrolase (beta-lactamase superfamily II)